jgi:hypothetical protein
MRLVPLEHPTALALVKGGLMKAAIPINCASLNSSEPTFEVKLLSTECQCGSY